MTYRRLIVGFLFLAIILPCVTSAEYPYRVFLEENLVSLDQPIVTGSFKISSDGMRYAYVLVDAGKYKVILDGKEGQSYHEITNLCFSPDSNHLAYIAKQDNRYSLVFDGLISKGYDGIVSGSLRISPDSNHYAFVAKSGAKWLVVTDTGEGKAYDKIGASITGFSPDSQSFAYTALVGDQWISVINNQESQAYDEISSLVFSPDSKRTAAVVRVGSSFTVLVDGEAGPDFSMIKPESLVFSPDSQQFGYIAAEPGEEFIVINHQAGQAYDRIVSQQMAFDRDCAQIAFAAQIQERQFIVLNGVEGQPYVGIMEEPPIFSANGNNMAYAAFDGANWLVILDGVEQTGYSNIGKGSLLFSNKSSRLAYTAKTHKGPWTVVVDGVSGRYYDDIGLDSLTFSPDGRNLVYSARLGDKWQMVLDNREGRPFDGIVTGGRQVRFNGSAFFYYTVLDGSKVVTIQERIPSKSDFVDFQWPSHDQKEARITPDLPIKEFKFRFNPPNGTAFIETTKTTDSVEVEMMDRQFYNEEIKIRTEINKSSAGYQINHLILKYQVQDGEDPAGGEALSVLEGVRFAVSLDFNGSITGFDGLENFNKELKKIPSKHYRKYKDYFTKEAMAQRLKNRWKASVEDFNGKGFQLGDVWDSSTAIPLPNGETSEVSVAVHFKEETVVDSAPCVLIRVEYDLGSSNLKKFLAEIIMKGVPRLTAEPEVDLRCEGESIINPNTLLGYSSKMEMVLKATTEMPELGKKDFIFRRDTEVTYEYIQ